MDEDHWKAVDAAKNCNQRGGFRVLQEDGQTKLPYRYTQQYHGWSLEYCMFLDNLKTIQITYNATRGEPLRYRGHFILLWKDPTNPGNMSIHENFTDAVRQRAAIAPQGHGYTHIPPQERTRQRSIDPQLRSQLRDECQKWSHLCRLLPSSSSSATRWNTEH